MKLFDNKGNLILERGKSQTKQMHFSPTLNMKGVKKTIRPTMLSQEEFFKALIKKNDYGDF